MSGRNKYRFDYLLKWDEPRGRRQLRHAAARYRKGRHYLSCAKCQACGYIECCSALLCVGGVGCFRLYTEEERKECRRRPTQAANADAD